MYYLGMIFIRELENSNINLINSNIKDLKTDIEELALDYFNNIDKIVREKMRQRGITIMKNAYVGYDTEYNRRGKLNEIISAQ